MIVIPTGSLEEKAKALLDFKTFTDVREVADLVKKAGVDLVHLLNTAVPDSRLSKEERLEYACQSILVALDDAEKVGTKLMQESIATEKTKDALKRIEEARNFVKNQLPAMLDLCLVAEDAVADGRLELREVVDVVEAARKVDWSVFASCFGFLAACLQKKSVAAEEPAPAAPPAPAPPAPAPPAPAPPAPAPPLPESPTPEPPLTQPQEEPEPLEVPEPPQPSAAETPAASATKPESAEVDHP
jgi:hypothetical protein